MRHELSKLTKPTTQYGYDVEYGKSFEESFLTMYIRLSHRHLEEPQFNGTNIALTDSRKAKHRDRLLIEFSSSSLSERNNCSFRTEKYLKSASKITKNPEVFDFHGFVCKFDQIFDKLRGLES